MDLIEWSERPPDDELECGLQLRRLGLNKLEAWCTSSKPIGCRVHFFAGRTRPHTEGAICEGCQAGSDARWKGYLGMYNSTSREQWIQEITPGAYTGLLEGMRAHGSLRGHRIALDRIRRAPNGQIRAEVYTAKLCDMDLPPEPQIIATLYRIWGIQSSRLREVQIGDSTIEHLRLEVNPNGAKKRQARNP